MNPVHHYCELFKHLSVHIYIFETSYTEACSDYCLRQESLTICSVCLVSIYLISMLGISSACFILALGPSSMCLDGQRLDFSNLLLRRHNVFI